MNAPRSALTLSSLAALVGADGRGRRVPNWQFRPQPQVQEYVEAYAARLGISRSAAINAIVTEHLRETEESK